MTVTTHQQFNFLSMLAGSLCVQPLFVLVIKGWSSGILVVGGVASLIVIIISKYRLFTAAATLPKSREFHFFILTYSLLFILIFISGLFHTDFHFSSLDSPARFLIAIPIFLLVLQVRFDITKILLQCMTFGLIFTIVNQEFFPTQHPWHTSRMSNEFADPLSFGYISLSFTLALLASLVYEKSQPVWLMTLKGISCCVGFYMSVMTESRSGWFAVPLVLIFLLLARRKHLTLRVVSLYLIFVLGTAIAAYSSNERIHSRISEGLNDLSGYSFQGIAPDTSIGLRITFLRIAYDMVSTRPLIGHGDTQINTPKVPDIVKIYASPFAIAFALSSGFHNEIVTNAVQYGLLAGFATLLLFLVPLGIYWEGLKKSSHNTQHAAAAGIAFTLTYFVSSFSTEVFGLKYTVSLYALITAILCAAIIQDHSEAP